MSERLVATFEKPVSSRSAPEAIVERILEALTSGELKAGDRLPDEAQLAKSFGVARMTLRSALVVLRELGVVSTARGRAGGSFVALDVRERLQQMVIGKKIGSAEWRSQCDWRRAISGEACFLAAKRGSAAQLKSLQQAANTFTENAMDVDGRRISDARLHLLIAEISGSAHLVDQERAIQEAHNIVYASMPRLKQAVQTASMDHDRMIEAILKRDGERARAEIYTHIESTYQWTCSILRLKLMA